MEMTRNNVFSSVFVGGSEKSRLRSVLALKRAGFSLADVQSDVVLPSRLHVTVFFPLTNWFVTGQNGWYRVQVCTMYARTCTYLHQSTNSVVNRTVWRTQIWRDKVRCFLLKELDCFTGTEECQNTLFPPQLFKSK